MIEADDPTFTVFEGTARLASGSLSAVRSAVLEAEQRGAARVLVFNDQTGAQTDLDFRLAGQAGADPADTGVRRSGRDENARMTA